MSGNDRVDPDINYLTKLVAKDQGISEISAWNIIRNKWIPNSQVAGFLTPESNTNPQPSAALIEQKQGLSSEKLRYDFELKRIENDDKKAERADRELKLQEQRIANEKEINLARINLEKDIAAQRIEQENKRLAQKEDFDNKLLLIQANKSNSGDIIEQVNSVRKLEKTFSDNMIARLEALGIDTSQLRKATGSEKSEGGSLLKILETILPIVEKATQTAPTPPLTPEQAAEQQRQQLREVEIRKQVDIEAKKKAIELEEANFKLNEEKEILEREANLRKQHQEEYYRQREVLISKASELGIEVDGSMNNELIFMAIEKHESEIEKEKRERKRIEEQEQAGKLREGLVARAIELKLPFDDDIPNEKLEDLILRKERGLIMKPVVQLEQPAADSVQVPDLPTKSRKQKKTKKQKAKLKFTVLRDGTSIKNVEAAHHKAAALKVAIELAGTEDAPVRVTTKDENGNEKIFDTFVAEVTGKGGSKYMMGRCRLVPETEETG